MEAWMEYDWMMDDRQGSGYWTPGDNRVTIETQETVFTIFTIKIYPGRMEGWMVGWMDKF